MPSNDESKDATKEQPQQEEPVLKTEQEAKDAASEVMRPDLHTTEVQFLNHKVKVRPLTAYYSKRIHDLMKPIQDKCSAYVEKYGIPDVDKPALPEADLEMDEELFFAWRDTLALMAEYYQLEDVTEDRIMKEMTLTDMEKVMSAQVEVAGKADFLLRPLKITLEGLRVLEKLDKEMMDQVEGLSVQSSTSSPPSPKPGEQTPSQS